MFNDLGAIICATGTAYFIEVRVQKLLEPRTTAPNTGVMEFNFESM